MNDTEGNLRKDLYGDGLHLNEASRDLWVHLISSAIEESQKNPSVQTEQLHLERKEADILTN